MKLTLQATFVGAIIFGLISIGIAIEGFASLGDIADAQQKSDATGFAWFWAFLACVCGLIATTAYWLTHQE